MVTRAQALRIEARVEELAGALGTSIVVVVFKGETAEFALARHRELRPDHAGRRVQLEQRPEVRDETKEAFAVCSELEVREWAQAIWARDAGKPHHFVGLNLDGEAEH
jgi:hypothetical protein